VPPVMAKVKFPGLELLMIPVEKSVPCLSVVLLWHLTSPDAEMKVQMSFPLATSLDAGLRTTVSTINTSPMLVPFGGLSMMFCFPGVFVSVSVVSSAPLLDAAVAFGVEELVPQPEVAIVARIMPPATTVVLILLVTFVPLPSRCVVPASAVSVRVARRGASRVRLRRSVPQEPVITALWRP
jgi:hypothetical protein